MLRLSCKAGDLPYLPLVCQLKTGEEVVLTDYVDADLTDLYDLMKSVVDDGPPYPLDKIDLNYFKSYHMTARPFVLRTRVDRDLVGVVFIRTAFPGRSSHICNASFAVTHRHRGKGALKILIKAYLRITRDLGYKSSFFSLVYSTNVSLQVYKKMGFVQIGSIPKAGNLGTQGMVDAIEFYYDLTTLDSNGQPPEGWTD